MVVKVKGSFEKSTHVKNNDKSNKYLLRGQRNARYQERILSNENKYILQQNFTIFLEDYNRYEVEFLNVH